MSLFPEKELQNGICQHLTALGWHLTLDDEALGRRYDEIIRFDELQEALIRLNPEIAENPARAGQVLSRLMAVLLSAPNDGLVAANEEFVAWLCGRRTILYIGTDQHAAVRIIDFENPRANSLRVTSEATFHAGREHRRYDIVLWVNGIPLVVGETKAPTPNTSWVNGAIDIHNGYEKKTPQFFVPNVLSFATDGRDFRYGTIRQPPETWLNWSKTTDEMRPEGGLATVMRSAELLLTPEMLLEILRHFTLYSYRPTSEGAVRQKIIPRYPQVEAVEAIIERCVDPDKNQGLVWHHQGSGKTFAMAYAAAKLRHIAEMDAPTIVIVLDRLDLIEQTSSEFTSVGISALQVAQTREDLQQMLSEDSRSVIVTTIYRFKDAGLLNERKNIVVMVDEAHRTQEGRLGLDMRTALPNAKFIGLTGTPIATDDKNTWALFGDFDDPDGVLSHYSVERSIFDGATLPVHVETRLVDFHLDAETLQQDFDALAEDENLDDQQKELLSRKASHFSVFAQNDQRVKAVCEDIVKHYRQRIAPLGLKAQIVTYDRATCVTYYEALQEILNNGEESAVVMTTAKDDPPEWGIWELDRAEEAALKNRFRDLDDPLKFLIVTSKLLTGFDAPIEGVMYLDKPLRAHTLFQAICRTNRRWTNPRTGQEKLIGLVVDYVGMGEQLARAVTTSATAPVKKNEGDINLLLTKLIDAVDDTWQRFSQIDFSNPEGKPNPALGQLQEASQIIDRDDAQQQFSKEFLHCQGLFEILYPDQRLKPIEDRYRFLAKVFISLQPSNAPESLLWKRLGAKTRAIVYENISSVTVDGSGLDKVALDTDALKYLKENKIIPDTDPPKQPLSAIEVLDRLDERLRQRIEGTNPHRVWRSLSERLEELRASRITNAEDSVRFLTNLVEVARDLVRAERADNDGDGNGGGNGGGGGDGNGGGNGGGGDDGNGDHGDTHESLDDLDLLILDPRRRGLKRILDEYGPENLPSMIERVVEEIDAIVDSVRGTAWQSSHPGDQRVRLDLHRVLRNFALPPTGDLYDRIYAYIRENY